MKIAAASLNQTPFDWDNNKGNIIEAIKKAQDSNVDVLCLPELCITGYGCEDMFLQSWLSEKSIEVLCEILPETKNIAVTLGLPMHLNNRIFNVVALAQDGKILGFQAKQNLPFDGIHYENRWFSEWASGKIELIEINGQEFPFGDQTYQIENKVIGFEICEDAWVEDRPACRLVEQKVDIILNPSASHFSLMKSVVRENRVVTASKEFNCTYVFANQLGNEAGRIIYDGDAIIAHKGILTASTPLFSFNNVELTITEIVDDSIQSKDINANHTSDNEQFLAATSLGLFDYLRKSRSNGFVVSLSGGADSATCIILANEAIKRSVDALGIDDFKKKINFIDNEEEIDTVKELSGKLITSAYQATENSSTETMESARDIAHEVNAMFSRWSIDTGIDHARQVIESAIDRNLTWEEDDIVLQNIQARCRSPLIWMLANVKNAILLTTSNRSEGSVGYTTMDGDTSGSLAPIAGIDKPFIRQWLRWAEENLGYASLNKVNSLSPTAELRPAERDQTDEDDLMPYEILNLIEGLFIKERKSPLSIYNELIKNHPKDEAADYIIKFFNLWSRNQWKRERIAPSFHLKDYNIDPRSWFRFPILSGGFKDELKVIRKLA
ncbi:MAG: NAD(+) synthase [Bacteroidota bacterium]